MKQNAISFVRLTIAFAFAFLISVGTLAQAQPSTGSLSFSVFAGEFSNPVLQSGPSPRVWIDNDLTNGYVNGFNLSKSPDLQTLEGAAAFQWGRASSGTSAPFSSAMWFEPSGQTITAIPGESFELGSLYYRNGIIIANTGARSVDLNIVLEFDQPTGVESQSLLFNFDLINSLNVKNPVKSADTVSWGGPGESLSFFDPEGNEFFLDFTFRPTTTTIANTLSTESAFIVKEGGTATATMIGTFREANIVPEPGSAALVGVASLLLGLRRRRKSA